MLRRKSVILFLVIPFTLYFVPAMLPDADAAKVTLGWDSNPEPDLEGYVVYRNNGSPGPPYKYADDLPEEDLDDPLHPKATLTGLQEGNEYYIALTAYNTEGVESTFSNNICVEVVNGMAEACSASTSPIASTSPSSGGGSSNSCFISTASQISLNHYQLWGALFILALIAASFYRQKKRRSGFPTTETAKVKEKLFK